VTDLTSSTFLMCLCRFIGRRGPARTIYCDNSICCSHLGGSEGPFSLQREKPNSSSSLPGRLASAVFLRLQLSRQSICYYAPRYCAKTNWRRSWRNPGTLPGQNKARCAAIRVYAANQRRKSSLL